jgi:transposase InsO family protein
MPWKTVIPMDQKIQLIADWQTKNFDITDLSKKYDLSRPTIYKWLNRYEVEGIEGLEEKNRSPKYRPNQTKDAIVELLIAEKLSNRKRGPKKIYYQLKERYPELELPSVSTIGEWLKKHGLVQKRKKRLRVPPYTEPFRACQKPNAVWSADFKGQFYTHDQKICYPLTISDNYSRYLLRCHGLPGPRYEMSKDVFERAFIEYGLPDAIRSDNGTPFAGRSTGGLSRLSAWFIQLGITPERIEKGCPQQNGRHERMHRTLKAESLDPISSNMKEQQKRFDWFRYDYNNNRPHESLNNEPPIKHYCKSNRTYVKKIQPPYYDYDVTVRKVKQSGEIKFKGNIYQLSHVIAKQAVGLKAIDDGIYGIYYYHYPLAKIDITKNKLIK